MRLAREIWDATPTVQTTATSPLDSHYVVRKSGHPVLRLRGGMADNTQNNSVALGDEQPDMQDLNIDNIGNQLSQNVVNTELDTPTSISSAIITDLSAANTVLAQIVAAKRISKGSAELLPTSTTRP